MNPTEFTVRLIQTKVRTGNTRTLKGKWGWQELTWRPPKPIEITNSGKNLTVICANSEAAKNYLQEISGVRYCRMVCPKDDPLISMVLLKFGEQV